MIPSVAWFTNQQVSNIQLDAGDGNGYQNLTVGQASPVFYPDSGLKRLNFKVMLSNSQVLYSHAQIHIANAVNPDDDLQNQYRTNALVSGPQEVESDETYDGKTAKGYMTIRYANPADPVLRRPLIIAEGYDPGNIIKPEEKFGLNDFEQFDREIKALAPNNLRQILVNNPQYDIVYVDWKNGTDDLYRNAKLLKKVIALVNADKEAVNGVMQPNVIIGQSMGGVIARIALKEMENANIAHQTRLFISQDAPQQGANVPIAYQYMGRHFRNIYISTGVLALGVELVQLIRGGVSPLKALSLSNEPASKQMLINYISDFGTLNNTHHDDFYASLRTLGYPTQCRIIAMSNGSECASSQGFDPAASLLGIDGKIQTRFLGDVSVSALSYFAAPLFPLNRLLKLGFLPGRNEVRANINLHAIGNGGNNQVYYCDITYTKKLFYLVNINLTLAHKEKNANSGMVPIDGYPGGFFAPVANLTSSTYTNWFFKYNINVTANRSFNFVPTTSSLDIGVGVTALASSDYLTAYSASLPPASPKQTPFANFIVANQNNGGSVNENHISFTARNAEWAGNEIGSVLGGPNPQVIDCTILCSNTTISGPSQFCTSATYSIPNLPSGATVSWTLPNTNLASVGTIANVAMLSRNNGNGNITLTANITSPCGNLTIVKTIRVGPDDIPIGGLITNATYGTGQYITLSTGGSYVNASNYSWLVYGASIVSGQGTNTINIITNQNTSTVPLYLDISLVINVAGCGDAYGEAHALVSSDGLPNPERAYIYPNPADHTLFVSQTSDKKSLNKGKNDSTPDNLQPFDAKLYNEKNQVVLQAKSYDGKEIQLNTAKLSNGIYFLHIYQGKSLIKKQIIIQH